MVTTTAFTLIELMIVISIVAITASIAVPNLLESRIVANEAKVASSLRSGFHPAQELFRNGGFSDWDSDGRGEYARDVGFLAGLTMATVNMQGETAVPFRALPSAFAAGHDPVVVDGFRYAMTIAYAVPNAVDGAENYYGVFSRPDRWNSDGRRGFAMLQDGQVFATSAKADPATIWQDPSLKDMFEIGKPSCVFGNSFTTEPGVPSAHLVPYRR